MNHNELVGWRSTTAQWYPIYLVANDIHARNTNRIDINATISAKTAADQILVQAQGNSRLAKLLYLIYLGDWASYYLAIQRGFDPIDIAEIIYLKDALAKL